MTATRTLTITAIDDIRIDGLTRGPISGWALRDGALVNPYTPNAFRLTPQAAQRVAAAAAQAVPASSNVRRLTGAQIAALPAEEAAEFRASCTYVGVHNGVHGMYESGEYVPAQPVQITLDRSDLA